MGLKVTLARDKLRRGHDVPSLNLRRRTFLAKNLRNFRWGIRNLEPRYPPIGRRRALDGYMDMTQLSKTAQ